MPRIAEHGQQLRVAHRATAVFGRRRASSIDATWVPDVRLRRHDALDHDFVLPGIAEVVDVEEPRTLAPHHLADRRAVLVLRVARLGPAVLDVRPPEPPRADLKLVQMGVIPREGDLQQRMELPQRAAALDLQTPPDGWADSAERGLELMNGRRLQASRNEPAPSCSRGRSFTFHGRMVYPNRRLRSLPFSAY